MKIYTRQGDGGETSLPDGTRAAKDVARLEACGTIDELSAVLGLVRAERLPEDADQLLQRVQSELLLVGAELAGAGAASARSPKIGSQHVHALEEAIDRHAAEVAPPAGFILPGGTRAAAGLHLARAVCRRAERRVVSLAHSEPAVGTLPIAYLNRLGDLLFVLARLANARSGTGDVLWRK